MKPEIMLILTVLVYLALGAVPARGDNLLHNPPTSKWTGRQTLTWLDGGNEIRYVDVYMPKSIKKADKVPVVMWFMGSRRNVRKDYHYQGISYQDADLETYAEKNRFMAIVIDQKHEMGRGWQMLDEGNLDEPLVLDVLSYLKKTFPVDETRVYLWGISAGGKLSQILASKHSDIFTAVVSFSGVIDDFEDPFFIRYMECIRQSARKFPIAHWQTEGDYENLITNMKGVLRLYREAGHPVEFVWLDNTPEKKLKHEWYPELYNQRMWDWCSQYRLVDGKTVIER